MSATPIHQIHPLPVLAPALDRLVSRGVLSPEQAASVLQEVDAAPDAAPTLPPVRPAARARIVEAAAYLGGVLVAASAVAFLAQSWEDLSEVSRTLLLALAGLAAYAIGVLVAVALPGGRAAVREHVHAARRRVAGVLMALGSVLLAFLATRLLGLEDQTAVLVGALVALVLLVAGQLLAPTAITEAGLLGATLLAVGAGTDLLLPDAVLDESDMGPDFVYVRQLPEIVIPVVLAVVGVLWGAVVARVLTLPVLAVALGSAAALVAALTLAVGPDPIWPGVVLLGCLAAVGIALNLATRAWPWIALAVLALTLLVFVVVAQQSAPALAFLLAGLVLLGGALGAWVLGRRQTRQPSTSRLTQ